MFEQLSYEDRVRIAELHQAKYTTPEIAKELKRDRSTIWRELQRNGCGEAYSAEIAQALAERRRSQRPIERTMERQDILTAVQDGLIQLWSPEQIAARQRKRAPDDPRQHVSGRTIRRWIQQQNGAMRKHWSQYLRRRGRAPFRPRKPAAAAARPVRNRPAIIERRSRLGDFEGDLMLGCPGSGGALVVVCRRSRFVRLIKVKNKTAPHVLKQFRKVLSRVDTDQQHSATFDNGGEFAHMPRLEKSHGLAIYSCEPGCPYQRGTNENTIGLLRQFFPKGIDFRTVTHVELRRAETLINNRPRRCLDYQTPNEVFFDIPINPRCN